MVCMLPSTAVDCVRTTLVTTEEWIDCVQIYSSCQQQAYVQLRIIPKQLIISLALHS